MDHKPNEDVEELGVTDVNKTKLKLSRSNG
jgi:hypothetical protein